MWLSMYALWHRALSGPVRVYAADSEAFLREFHSVKAAWRWCRSLAEPHVVRFVACDGSMLYPSTLRRLATTHPLEFAYRRAPVPGVRRPRWHRGCYYRLPRTQAERRAWAAYEDALEDAALPPPRPRRRAAHLITAWDESRRTREQSWKAHRRTQWKERS